MDMFDYMEKIGKPALDDGINVILDRYYYSNMYYRLASNDSLRAFSMNKIIFDVEVLAKAAKLPKADIVIKMISNKKMLENILASKENKDSNEKDIDYMIKVQNEFNIFDFKELLANGGKQIDIHICGKDGIPFEKNIIYANIITEVRGVLDAE
jgi:thymidylate kinase